MINCAIISIGDELLIGQVVNTNATMIANKLGETGINIQKVITIGDIEKDILETLQSTFNKYNITIITGGLGPTTDDITKNCACKFFDCNLSLNENVYEHLKKLLKNRTKSFTESNKQQAMLPDKCIALRNKIGTASGMWFESDDKKHVAVFLPGVPIETEKLLDNEVIPKLNNHFKSSGLYHKTINTFGLAESIIAERIKDWYEKLPDNITLAYLPDYGDVKLRLTAYGNDIEENQKIINQKILELKSFVDDVFFSYDNDSLPQVVGNLLKEQHKTLSIAESCTGGYLSHLITSIPGSSEYFMGGIIAYDNKIKTDILNIDNNILIEHGAVSIETVEKMASNVAKVMNTDIGLAITGIAGPDGGTPLKPVGTIWIAVYYKGKTTTKLLKYGSNRIINIKRASMYNLKLLYDNLITN